ncbi:hypothetical protein MPTK2_8g04280 [Marchantia polymorpha subsp. ruderalis]
MSFKAWRVKVCIAQSDPSLSPLPAPRLASSAAVRSEPSRSPSGGGKPPAVVCPRLKQLLMDVGVSPSASPNPKVSKPSLGVRVLRTLFDNSPPTYTSAKSQAAAKAAAQAKEQREQELLKAQGAKNGIRTPTPQRQVEEPQVAWRESPSAPSVIDKLAEKSGRFPPGLKKNGRKVAHAPSRASLESSSFDSREDAHSSVSTDFEYDPTFNRYHDKEVRNMNRSAVRNHDDDYELGSGRVDDSLLPDLDADLDSAQKLEHLKQEIERLRFENLVLKQRGVASERHPYRNDSDLSRASSVTEVSNSEEAAEWIPYAEYHPSTVGTASVARFHGPQPNGNRRNEMPRHPPGERYFPGEHASRALNAGWGHGSSSDTVSMVTDGSRASSRHHSGLLNENEPQSGLTSRHNSGLRSDMEDLPSMMSWDGSRHNSGPMVVDRQELYGLTTPNSSIHSRNSSGMLVDEPLSRGGTMSPPLGANSREPSRHNSGMQVDRHGRGIPHGLLLSPRISFEGNPLPVAAPISLPLPLSNSSVATANAVDESFSHHRVYARERNLVEPESRHSNSSRRNSDVRKNNDEYHEYDDDDHRTHQLQLPNSNRGSSRNVHNNNNHNQNQNDNGYSGGGDTSRGNSSGQAMRSYENHEAPSPPPNYAEQYEDFNDEGGYRGGLRTNNPSPQGRRASTPPKSRGSQSGESDLSETTNSTMFSYQQQPSAVPAMITVPRSRSAHSQKSNEDLSQFLMQQGQQSLSMDSAQINTVPRSRSTHSQMSTEESSTVQNQHQSTLERLMVSQQRRQNMSGTPPMSVNASPEQQYSSRHSRHIQTRSPYRR